MTTSTNRGSRHVRAFAALVPLLFLPTLGQAQGLPPAKDLIAKWAAATSADGWKSHKSSRMKATFDMPAQGISANMEQVTIYPTQSAMKIDIPGMGEVRNGFDGTTAWAMNPMQGPSVTTGAQLEAQKEDNHPANYSRITPAIVSSETVEKATISGQECYKVKHKWKSGKTSTDCFSVADGMIIWSQQTQTGPMGEVETTITYSAYKDFGGVKRATTTTFEAMGQQQVITMTGWEWDTVDPKEIEIPAEIKALVEKKPS